MEKTEKVKWELIRNGKEIISSLIQDAEDLEVNGRGYPLSWLVPEEHADAAFWSGEWDEEGYNYHLDNGDTYLVRYYPVPDNRKE